MITYHYGFKDTHRVMIKYNGYPHTSHDFPSLEKAERYRDSVNFAANQFEAYDIVPITGKRRP